MPETGDTLVYKSKRGEGRELSEAVLVRQLRAAGILGKRNRAFNPQANLPRGGTRLRPSTSGSTRSRRVMAAHATGGYHRRAFFMDLHGR